MKCDATCSVLVVIDLQQRLGDAMPGKVLSRVIQNTVLLLRSAELLAVPVLHTEQYPQGLGPTEATVKAALPTTCQSFSKRAFSCCGHPDFIAAAAALGRRQMILVGMEAHICVLQTALDLYAVGYDVLVVEDAVCSRRLENYQNALDRLRNVPLPIVSAESVVFEWMQGADHPQFKTIQGLLR
jgi:nicotinamidase-related amidase